MSIRLRLASWCAAIFSVLFIALAIFIYEVHARALYSDLDETLASVTMHYQGEIERQLASGAPLTGSLVSLIDTEGQPLVRSELTIYDATGRIVLGRSLSGAAPATSFGASSSHGPVSFLTIDTPNGRVRVHTMPLGDSSLTVGYVQTTVSLANLDRSISRLRLALFVATASGLVVAIVGSLATAARALRPVAEVTETARAITLARAFGRRLDPIATRDELGELTRTFNEMLDSLEEVHRAQRRFIDDAAHELRAPLTSIIGNLELLERAQGLSATEQRVVLNDVCAEARRMGRMVNHLLTLARANAGQHPPQEPVDLDRIVLDVVRQAKLLADGVDLGIGEFVPVVVQGDGDRLRELLYILLENALGYTPAGGKVRLDLRVVGGETHLTVADTGIGIAPDDLPYIFDRFFRADPARSRVAGGSGLGLAIAKWIAEVHEGRIEVESRVSEGSTFTVTLPLAVDHSNRIEREETAEGRKGWATRA